MSNDKISPLYGKPRFGLIVGMFAAAIVVLLIAGWLFLRSGTLKMRNPDAPRTGMVLVMPRPLPITTM